MKNISFSMLFFVLFLALPACKKEEGIALQKNTFPVKVTQNVALPYTVTSKDNIVFDVTISSEETIKTAVLSLDGNELQSANATAGNQVALKYSYEVQGNDVGKSLIFRLSVSDGEGNSVDKDFTVYVQLAPADIRITLPGDAPAEILDNETADFMIAVASENDIKYIKTFIGENEITALTKETFTNPKQDAYHFTYQATVADADKTLPFTIEVMDVMGNIVKQDYSLSIKRSQAADFAAYYDVNLGAQRSTAHGPFFNASSGEVYVTTGAAAKSAGIDLVTFYSGSTFAYNIVSPTLPSIAEFTYTVALFGADAISNWPVRNQTLIKKITLSREAFDLLASGADIEALYTGSGVAESETSGGLANNNVIVFRTAANKYGALYVKSRSANANTGYLTVDIKVQK